MNDNIMKYYKILVTNPFIEGSIKEKVYAMKKDNDYYEILTGKKIYVLENKIPDDVLKDDYFNKKCSYIGISKELCFDSEVSKYLVFEVISRKKEILDNLDNIEGSILNYFSKNKTKIIKK